MMRSYRYLRARPDAKGNAVICSNSKLMPNAHWNESKTRGLRQIKNTGGLHAEFPALIAASATVAAASPAVPAAGVARCAGIVGGGAVAAKPGRKVPAVAAGAGARAGAVATGTRAPGAAVLPPAHQEVANHRRPADRYYQCCHSARHGVLGFRWRLRFVSAKWPEIHRSSPNEARPFIDHLSEMWNFCRQTASMLSFCSTRKVRP